MGEMADYYVDRMIGESFSFPRHRPKGFQYGVGFGRWKDSTGKVINMSDMDDRYLNNCLRICEKRGNGGKAKEIKAEFIRRKKAEHKEPPYDLGDW